MFDKRHLCRERFQILCRSFGAGELQKTMKNPLFRAYYEEAAGIAQGISSPGSKIRSDRNRGGRMIILVSAL